MNKRRKKDSPLWQRVSRRFSSKEGNLTIVLLCLAAATTFWFFNALNKSDYTTRLNYPIVFSYPTDSTYLLSQLPENISVQVNGGGWNLLRKTLLVNTRPVQVTLNEPTKVKAIPGQSLIEEVEAVLGDVRLNYIVTDTLRINIDSMLEKQVHLVVDSARIGLEENHWFTSPISVSPRSVILHGPASVVSQARDTLLIRLPDREIDQNYEETIPLSYINSMVNVIPREAQVVFGVAPFVSFKKRVPLITVGFPQDSSVYLGLDQVTVNFWVKESLANQGLLDSTSFTVVADLSAVNPRDSTVAPMVREHPAYAHRITVRPVKLKVRYGS